MLTAPRVYFAMAKDKLFFQSVARLNERTQAPVLAIALQGALAIIIALSGKYEQILNYVVSVDFIWFGLTAASLFVFRNRADRLNTVKAKNNINNPDGQKDSLINPRTTYNRVPGHPFTTILFVAACALIVFSTFYNYPGNSVIGLIIVIAGIPVYFFWRRGA
jgi:APA family basic amino acid/polyamine antiporter